LLVENYEESELPMMLVELLSQLLSKGTISPTIAAETFELKYLQQLGVIKSVDALERKFIRHRTSQLYVAFLKLFWFSDSWI
jgi:hypothetical protein